MILFGNGIESKLTVSFLSHLLQVSIIFILSLTNLCNSQPAPLSCTINTVPIAETRFFNLYQPSSSLYDFYIEAIESDRL